MKIPSFKQFLSGFVLVSFFILVGCKTNESTQNTIKAPSIQMGSTKTIALLLPTTGPHAPAAKAIRDGFLAAYYEAKQQKEPSFTVKVYDTSSKSVVSAYQEALNDHSTVIVGPLTKPEVEKMAKLPIHVPIIALNTVAEDPRSPKDFYQFGLMPEDEVIATAELALKQHHRRALVLAPHTEWGLRIADTFKRFWVEHQGQIVDVKFFKSNTEIEATVQDLLKVQNQSQRRNDADMIFLAANPDQARQIKPLLNLYQASDLPVYGVAALYTGVPSPTHDRDLNGIYFCDMPWVISSAFNVQEQHQTFEKLWPSSKTASTRFFALGLDAYQLAVQLENTQAIHTVNGMTGKLRLNNYQRIERELICAKFENGIPISE